MTNYLSSASFKEVNYYTGIEEVPRMVITLHDNKQYGYPGEPVEIELGDYKGFIDRVVGKSIYVKIMDPKVFLSFESKYLGNNLRDAIQALNLKPGITGEVPNINQDFYCLHERPWDAFLRISRYLPVDYHMACLGDKISIFKTPGEGEFTELSISKYTTEANYNRDNERMVVLLDYQSDSGSNPCYANIYSLPISKMMLDNLNDGQQNNGIDVINNYLSRYKNRNLYYPENLLFQSTSAAYNLGDGVIINGAKLMIISKSVTIGSVGSGGGVYRCIKVG